MMRDCRSHAGTVGLQITALGWKTVSHLFISESIGIHLVSKYIQARRLSLALPDAMNFNILG